MSFQIHALPPDAFRPFFPQTDAELAVQNIHRVTAQSSPGYPCRISLEEAPAGDTLLLLNHTHLDAETPYASAHAIYVREGAAQAHLKENEVPGILTARQLSVRGFDSDHMIITAAVIDGAELALTLDEMFGDPKVQEVHVHAAARGCYLARATRA